MNVQFEISRAESNKRHQVALLSGMCQPKWKMRVNIVIDQRGGSRRQENHTVVLLIVVSDGGKLVFWPVS